MVWYTPYQFRIGGNVCLSFCKTNYDFKMSYRYEFFLIDFVMYFILCLEILQQRIFAKTFFKIFVCLMVHIFLTSRAFFFAYFKLKCNFNILCVLDLACVLGAYFNTLYLPKRRFNHDLPSLSPIPRFIVLVSTKYCHVCVLTFCCLYFIGIGMQVRVFHFFTIFEIENAWGRIW